MEKQTCTNCMQVANSERGNISSHIKGLVGALRVVLGLLVCFKNIQNETFHNVITGKVIENPLEICTLPTNLHLFL